MALGVIDKWLALRLAQAVLASRAVSEEESIHLRNVQQIILRYRKETTWQSLLFAD